MVLVCLTISSQAQFNKLTSRLSVNPVSSLTNPNDKNIAGLKNSLNIGIEKAVGKLGVENGFFNDAALKLLLPTEAKSITENIKLIPGGQSLLNKTVLSLNRSAEDAVKDATPIFKNAILKMSIKDATGILFGKENAATEYLRQNTYNELKAAFAPKVKASLGKPLVADMTTEQTWNTLCSSHNKVANTTVGKISGMKSVNVNIQDYVTEKALDALFIKIAAEEKSIRTDPTARVNDLLKSVFGQLDKK